MGIRNAKIPCPAKEERVSYVIPLMFYDGDIFFIRGLTGGAKLYNKDKWQFSLIFESSSAFGRIKGGSNYNSLYLQYHF